MIGAVIFICLWLLLRVTDTVGVAVGWFLNCWTISSASRLFFSFARSIRFRAHLGCGMEWNEWIRPVSVLFYFIWLTLKFPAWWLNTTSIDHFSAKWQPILWGGAENPPLWAGFWDADPSTNSVPHRHIYRPGQHVGWEFSQSHRKKIWPQRPEATHGHLSSNLHTTRRDDKHWGSVLHLLNSSFWYLPKTTNDPSLIAWSSAEGNPGFLLMYDAYFSNKSIFIFPK